MRYTYQVVTEKLHDEGRVLVGLLGEGVKLCDTISFRNTELRTVARTRNSVIESLLSQLASLVGRVEDLVIEDGEVEGQTQADRVCRSQALGCDLSGSLVSL
jgi:hypothetical protein